MKALPKDKKQRVKDAFKYALDVHTLKWAFNERPQDLAMFKILYISKDAVKEDEVHLSLELILITYQCVCNILMLQMNIWSSWILCLTKLFQINTITNTFLFYSNTKPHHSSKFSHLGNRSKNMVGFFFLYDYTLIHKSALSAYYKTLFKLLP